jgi:hypothetical protein
MRDRGEIRFARYRGKSMVATAEVMRVHRLMVGSKPDDPVRDLIRDLHAPRSNKVKLKK